jgi:hypothetical protein
LFYQKINVSNVTALEASCQQAVIALVTKDSFCPMIRAHVRAARGLAHSFKGRIRNCRSA